MKFLRSLLEEMGQDQCLRCSKKLDTKPGFDTGICADCWDPEVDGDYEEECEYMEVFVDPATNKILNEAAVRMFKRKGKEIKRMYRCTTGPKKGKPVSDPKKCATRKDPKKKRIGRKVARTRKGVRIRKTKIAKRTAMSKMVTRMNQRLKGARSTPAASKSSPSKSSNTKSPDTTKSSSTKKPKTIKGLGKPQKPKKIG